MESFLVQSRDRICGVWGEVCVEKNFVLGEIRLIYDIDWIVILGGRKNLDKKNDQIRPPTNKTQHNNNRSPRGGRERERFLSLCRGVHSAFGETSATWIRGSVRHTRSPRHLVSNMASCSDANLKDWDPVVSCGYALHPPSAVAAAACPSSRTAAFSHEPDLPAFLCRCTTF